MLHTSKSFGSLRAAARADSAPPPPQRDYPVTADEYELLEECGRGVSATVWRAMCKPFDEIVAVKLMDLENVNCSLEEIVREAQTMRQQAHPNILPLHCSFVHGQHLWMVMPYVQGGSALNIMKYAHPDGLEEPIIATIMRDVLRALAYIHAGGGIHRDVKAGNILVDGSGRVMLADFGVAATMERGGSWGGGGGGAGGGPPLPLPPGARAARTTFVGTPCWMAPEVMEQAEAGYTSLADVWSFGITLLELAHGAAPFARYPPMKVLLMTIQNPPPTLDSAGGDGRGGGGGGGGGGDDGGGGGGGPGGAGAGPPGRRHHFSKAMRDIVAKCLVKDPARRPSAAALLEHKFFKTAHDGPYLVRHLLAGLPPVAERAAALRSGRAPSGAAAGGDAGAAVASQAAYVAGVSAWNFDVAALKAEAGLGVPRLSSIDEAGGGGGGGGGEEGAPPPPPQPPASPGAAAAAAAQPPPPLPPPLQATRSTKRQGRFEVYEGDEPPPPLSPGAAGMASPAAAAAGGGDWAAAAGEGTSRPPSAAPEGAPRATRKAGRFQVVEDEAAGGGGGGGGGGEGGGEAGTREAGGTGGGGLATAASSSVPAIADADVSATLAALVPPLREAADALAAQVDALRDLVGALADAGRGRPKPLATLLEEVTAKAVAAAAGPAEAARLRREVGALQGEAARLRERLRVAEEEVERVRR